MALSTNQKRAAGIGLVALFALAGGLALVAFLALVGGGGWWYYSGEPTEDEVAVLDDIILEEEVADEEILTDEEEVDAVADAGESWWTPEYWGWTDEPDDSTSDGTVADGGNVDETSDSTTTTIPPTDGTMAPVIVKGVTPYGNAFPAPGKSGAMASTLTVVMGDVPNSARSQAGEMETYWGQGVYQNATDGTLRATIGKKVVNPDVVREKVGINTAWTSLPGYTGVSFTCKVIQAENGASPAGCSRPTASTPSQVASR